MRAHITALALALGTCSAACSSDTAAPRPELSEEDTYGTTDYQRDPNLNIENISEREGTFSHNQGLNCMNCHQEYGPGRGLFTLAGTAYDAEGKLVPNITLYLERRVEGEEPELVLELEGDALGNFYTTAELPFPEQQLYVSVVSEDGSLKGEMPHPLSNGACNHCHSGGFPVRLHFDDGAAGASGHH